MAFSGKAVSRHTAGHPYAHIAEPVIMDPVNTAAETTSSGATGRTEKLSCSSCRARKIKCDKKEPCAHCARSGRQCIFPSRKRMQRPKKTGKSELMNRLSRLEEIVGRVDQDSFKDFDMSDVNTPVPPPLLSPGRPMIHPFLEGNETPPSAGPALQRRHSDNHTFRYLSGQFWSNLCDEVEGLKQVLETDTDSDENSESETLESGSARISQPFTVQGLLSGGSAAVSKLVHPPPDQMRFLVGTYFQNVDPMIKMLHQPSVLDMVASRMEILSTSEEALMFAIYFAAVTSLPPSTSLANFGQELTVADLCEKYQLAVESALAAADYLNNADIECLQALTIYVACLRCRNGSRSSWVLVALTLRLAQALNLHRDGDGSRFTPYEAEMRRRLYWSIVVLDIRAAEDRGTEAMIARDSYNTRLPLNINDSDFSPDYTGPLQEREGPSDMTFSRCTAQISNLFLYVGHPTARLGGEEMQSEDKIIRHAQNLEKQFVTGADPSHLGSYLASILVRIINLKLWLVMQYPVHPKKPQGANSSTTPRWPKVSREIMLQTAVNIIQLHKNSHTGPHSDRFSWWGNTYVQWHPLAVCLAELCVQTRGPLVETAWKTVEEIFPKWSERVADSRKGTLWRPIRKLYRKAKAARGDALREDWNKAEAAREGALGLLSTGLMAIRDRAVAANDLPVQSESAIDPQLSYFGLSDLPMSPSGFHQDAMGWLGTTNFPDTTDEGFDILDWSVWNDFVNDTYADPGSRTGSSEES